MIAICPKCKRTYPIADGDTPGKYACECGGKLYDSLDPAFDEAIRAAAQSAQQAQTTGKLMPCPDCSGKVSKRAAICPHCGAPLQNAQEAPSEQAPTAPLTASAPQMPQGRLKVDTGENALNRNRGCADLLIFIPGGILIIVLIVFLLKCCNG